ncbi:MAG: ABC transporter permease [Sphaerochaeta sp.]|nr:ABC transporter permease [Sphaerochaeta sp.]
MKQSNRSARAEVSTGNRESPLPKRIGLLVGLVVLLLLFIFFEQVQIAVLSFIFPSENAFTHSRKTILEMTGEHVALSLLATALAALVGILIGVGVTRKGGEDFQLLIMRLNGFIQTFPPSAVIILAYPVLGFGWKPALLALFLYSLFPILGNTVVGFQGVPPEVKESARGMGMTPIQQLWIAEFPQAWPMVLTGIRHSYILNLGTAAIAAVIGGGGLGTIIISGLALRNSALVMSGTIVISLLAFIGEQAFLLLSRYART